MTLRPRIVWQLVQLSTAAGWPNLLLLSFLGSMWFFIACSSVDSSTAMLFIPTAAMTAYGTAKPAAKLLGPTLLLLPVSTAERRAAAAVSVAAALGVAPFVLAVLWFGRGLPDVLASLPPRKLLFPAVWGLSVIASALELGRRFQESWRWLATLSPPARASLDRADGLASALSAGRWGFVALGAAATGATWGLSALLAPAVSPGWAGWVNAELVPRTGGNVGVAVGVAVVALSTLYGPSGSRIPATAALLDRGLPVVMARRAYAREVLIRALLVSTVAVGALVAAGESVGALRGGGDIAWLVVNTIVCTVAAAAAIGSRVHGSRTPERIVAGILLGCFLVVPLITRTLGVSEGPLAYTDWVPLRVAFALVAGAAGLLLL